jgi:hypothetical protein
VTLESKIAHICDVNGHELSKGDKILQFPMQGGEEFVCGGIRFARRADYPFQVEENIEGELFQFGLQ